MSNVVPAARSLGRRALYETLFRNVFATGQPVLKADARAYCLSTQYGAGADFEAAIELLTNIGILKTDGEYLLPDVEFVQFAKENTPGPAVSWRLVDRLAVGGEIESIFPPGALSWRNLDGEMNIHLSHIPL